METENLFSQLAMPGNLLDNLASLGYTQMTPIQAASLPEILAGKDVIGQSETGSGKTAAFGLGLLASLDVSLLQAQCLVLCPTRELADQVTGELRRLARGIGNVKILTLCGGVPFGPQAASLRHGVHIVVGTPGRIEDHLRKGKLDLSGARQLVLDEADRMLDMGFEETIDMIIAQLPQARQSLLFSATFPDQIDAISRGVLRDPVHITVGEQRANDNIRQLFFEVDEDQRNHALRLLLLEHKPSSALVFCTTREQTRDVTKQLWRDGFSALALHGDLEQRDRDETLVRFSNGSALILVATDVAARGLDIEALDAVINYQLARDTETHLHRIGRTGRAGSTGLALSLYSSREAFKVEALLKDVAGQGVDASATLPSEDVLYEKPPFAAMQTLQLDGGRKQKLRPGDILGALTRAAGLPASSVGKINTLEQCTYVAINRADADKALDSFAENKLKGRKFRARLIQGP